MQYFVSAVQKYSQKLSEGVKAQEYGVRDGALTPAVRAGDTIPDFDVTDQRGDSYPFADLLADGPVVLFFFPAAFTPGCTKESCHFRDLAGEFEAVGARPVGISDDRVEKQADFDARHGLGFTLLSDDHRRIAGLFGVGKLGPLKRRVTFVIDRDGTVAEVIRSDLNMNVHADRALEVLRGLPAA